MNLLQQNHINVMYPCVFLFYEYFDVAWIVLIQCSQKKFPLVHEIRQENFSSELSQAAALLLRSVLSLLSMPTLGSWITHSCQACAWLAAAKCHTILLYQLDGMRAGKKPVRLAEREAWLQVISNMLCLVLLTVASISIKPTGPPPWQKCCHCIFSGLLAGFSTAVRDDLLV